MWLQSQRDHCYKLQTSLAKYVEVDVGHEREREEETENETKQVRVIINPGQETGDEEDDEDEGQLAQSHERSVDDLPVLNDLHEEAGDNGELRTGWASLRRWI